MTIARTIIGIVIGISTTTTNTVGPAFVVPTGTVATAAVARAHRPFSTTKSCTQTTALTIITITTIAVVITFTVIATVVVETSIFVIIASFSRSLPLLLTSSFPLFILLFILLFSPELWVYIVYI